MRIIDLCFFFKHKTAYELRISDGSSDVCSSDLLTIINLDPLGHQGAVAKNQVSTVVDKGAGGVPLIIANSGAVLQQAPMHAQHDEIGVFLCNAVAGPHRSQIVGVPQRAAVWSPTPIVRVGIEIGRATLRNRVCRDGGAAAWGGRVKK